MCKARKRKVLDRFARYVGIQRGSEKAFEGFRPKYAESTFVPHGALKLNTIKDISTFSL